VDADAMTDQAIGSELSFRCVAEPGEPFEGNENGSTIFEAHRQLASLKGDGYRAGLIRG
jgi:hypothetical protein